MRDSDNHLVGQSSAPYSNSMGPPGPYNLVWNDEFSQTGGSAIAIDCSKWNIEKANIHSIIHWILNLALTA